MYSGASNTRAATLMCTRDYTESDAWVDIVSMQIPASFTLAGSFVYSFFVTAGSEFAGPLVISAAFCMAWFFVAAVLIILDLITIPSVFLIFRILNIK
jgi:hypothetical protein